MIHTIQHAAELAEVMNRSGSLLVYFYNDHCAPCISLRPKIEELILLRFPEMELAYVNSEQFPGLTAEHGAFSFPVLIFFFGGKEFLRYSKYVSVSELDNAVGRLYDLYHG